jgi:hypothetical protein
MGSDGEKGRLKDSIVRDELSSSGSFAALRMTAKTSNGLFFSRENK